MAWKHIHVEGSNWWSSTWHIVTVIKTTKHLYRFKVDSFSFIFWLCFAGSFEYISGHPFSILKLVNIFFIPASVRIKYSQSKYICHNLIQLCLFDYLCLHIHAILHHKLTWEPCLSIQNTLKPCHRSHPLEMDSQSTPTHNYTIIDEISCAIIGVTGNHHPPSENWPGSVGGCCNYFHPIYSPSKTSERGATIWTYEKHGTWSQNANILSTSFTIVSQIIHYHHSQSAITRGLFFLRSSHIKLAPGTVAIMSDLIVFPSTNGLPLMKNTCNERGAVMLTCVCAGLKCEKYTGDTVKPAYL